MTPITVTTEYPQWHHCSYPCVGLLSGWEGNVERQQGTWRQRKQWNAALSILQLFRLACICVRKRYVRPGVHQKRPFWKVSLLGGVNSSLTSPKKGTAADTGSYCMLSNFLFPSNNCVFFSKQSIHKHQRGSWATLPGYHFLPHPPSLLTLPQFLLVLLISLSFSPTTRWRRVFCSGNSVCRTRCWLSEVLWPFQQLLGASGPIVMVFYHLSGLGISSGSKKNSKDNECIADRTQTYSHCYPKIAMIRSLLYW